MAPLSSQHYYQRENKIEKNGTETFFTGFSELKFRLIFHFKTYITIKKTFREVCIHEQTPNSTVAIKSKCLYPVMKKHINEKNY